ncbi:MAG: succinyl-diaminopimelate desuccinylase [Desulfurococcales archaeon ex4484_217_2]|nr:MAG: succinyl-diaminopimelate desuccinylase [Desulfurococcales archaeon ex4484_217_2]
MSTINEFLKETISLTKELIKIDTTNPPGNELLAAEFLASWMEKHGYEVHIQEIEKNRGNVIGIIKGTGEKPALILNGHLDVVPAGRLEEWSYDPFGAEVVENKIYGRGSTDMKGAVAAMAVAGYMIAKENVKLKGDLIVSAVAGEEVNSIGAKYFAETDWFRNSMGIVIGEPTAMDLVVAHKGALWVKIKTYGKAAHGSLPHLGVNAILHMVEVIRKLTEYRFKYEPVELLTPPTMNIGTIRGGIKTNVVPDYCEITVDMRTLPTQKHEEIIEDLNNILKELQEKIPNFKAELEVANNRKPLLTDPKSPLVLEARKAYREVFGIEPEPKGVTYYTDASEFLLHPRCPPIIIIGPGRIELAHKPNEYVEIDLLAKSLKYYYTLSKIALT